MGLIFEVGIESFRSLEALVAVTTMKLNRVPSRSKMSAQGSLVVEFCAAVVTAPNIVSQRILPTCRKGVNLVLLERFVCAKAFVATAANIRGRMLSVVS